MKTVKFKKTKDGFGKGTTWSLSDTLADIYIKSGDATLVSQPEPVEGLSSNVTPTDTQASSPIAIGREVENTQNNTDNQ